MDSPPVIFVIDDDPQIRHFLEQKLEKSGLRAISFDSAEDFLGRVPEHRYGASCLLLDVRMPGIGGLGLQEILNRDGTLLPVIFLTVATEIPVVVQAMRAGALDFCSKTIPWDQLLQRVQKAIAIAARWQADREASLAYEARRAELTDQERHVFDLLVAGDSSKEIGAKMGISLPSVARHRAHVFQKFEVRNAVELARQSWRFVRPEPQQGFSRFVSPPRGTDSTRIR